MHQVGIPISVAKKLTIPVEVTRKKDYYYKRKLDKKPSPIKFVIRPNLNKKEACK